ncbi:MAG TPA: dual specificity protein phosphatase 23 [Candidatus Brocadiia bacterium]|nr:dual specificity protein phosphatase 23 [Candidatus Brocadiia bacterium]
MIPNFGWLLDNRLAGMSRPGKGVNDLEFLRDQAISAIVSLTETPLSKTLLDEFAFHYLHLPIPDFEAPSQEQIDAFVAFVDEALSRNEKVAVHCAAGYGRTGTMLACYLVYAGSEADDAINEVRARRPGSIETSRQEDAIRAFAARRFAGR